MGVNLGDAGGKRRGRRVQRRMSAGAPSMTLTLTITWTAKLPKFPHWGQKQGIWRRVQKVADGWQDVIQTAVSEGGSFQTPPACF